MQKLLLKAMILGLGLVCAGALAQYQVPTTQYPNQSPQCNTTTNNKWRYSLTPYIWFSGINGDIAVRGLSASIDESFSDLAKHLDMGLQLHFEAQKDNWGYFIDPTYIKLSADNTVQGVPISADFKEWLVDFCGIRRYPLRPRGTGNLPQAIDLLFGGRYWNLSGDLNVGNLSTSVSQSWVDPIVGFRYATVLSNKWSALGRFDFGGFGVGSDFTWNISAVFGYKTSENGSLLIGYRALNVDRESGSGTNFFKWDVTYSGPEIGYQFRF